MKAGFMELNPGSDWCAHRRFLSFLNLTSPHENVLSSQLISAVSAVILYLLQLSNCLHRTKPFLRTYQVLSYSRNSPPFMGPEGSLPHSQEPITCTCPEPDRSSTSPPFHFSKIHFNIILPSSLQLPDVIGTLHMCFPFRFIPHPSIMSHLS